MEKILHSLQQRVVSATADKTPLRIRAGGSKDFYGQSLAGEQLDVSSYRGIVSYEPTELVVTVRAGTPLQELETLLAQHGQCLPFEAPHFSSHTTLGGAVAAGLSGPARASVGALRDYVLGAVLMNGKGEVLHLGGQVMKNVAGYDVSRLLVGSLGTLGVILEVSLKVLPIAPAEATLRFFCTQREALEKLNQWGGQPLPLNASAWRRETEADENGGAVEGGAVEGGQGSLYVRLRGAVAAVLAATQTMGGELIDNTFAHAFWHSLRNQSHAFFKPQTDTPLLRLSVPQTAPVLNTKPAQLIEWHGAQRWLHSQDINAMRAWAAQVGGHCTVFRFAGSLEETRFTPLQPAVLRIHQALKKQFDPSGIFNQGRLYLSF